MPSQVVSATIHAVQFSVLSSCLAVLITSWQKQTWTFDPFTIFMYMLIAVIMTPPNFWFQKWLEDTFPARVPVKPAARTTNTKPAHGDRLSKSNTVKKFCLDQTLAASANTAGFILLVGLLRGKSQPQISSELAGQFWPMITASWRVWPMVCIANLVLVPFDYRMMVGNIVGVCWGVYVNMLGL